MNQVREEDRLLIDRYLSNGLSGTELHEFMSRLDTDAAFRDEVVFQNLLVDAIREADSRRLENSILETIRYKKPLIPLGLRLILLFLLVTASGIFFWEYIGTGSISKEKRPKFSFDLFRLKPKSSGSPKEKKKEVVMPDTSFAESASSETEITSVEMAYNILDSSDVSSSGEDVIVKKDQLLFSIPIKPIPLDDLKEEKSMAQSTADKLNPAAGLPETKEAESVQVEFWISPVNYKGYRLINDKLVLFGIEEPDAVRLYSLDGGLLMKYGKEYFKLQPASDFVSFNVVKENSLPAAIR